MSQRICTCGAADYNEQQQQYEQQRSDVKQRRPKKPVVDAKTEVYVFIRARREHYEYMKNCMVLEAKIIENYNGTVIGLTDQVYVTESTEEQSPWVGGNGEPRYCMMVLRFATMAEADRWSYSDRVFKQQDCLPPNEMIEGFIVPMKHLPPDDCCTFIMMNIRNVRDAQAFQERFIDEVVPLMDENDVEQGVVSVDEIVPLRRSWVSRGNVIFVHQAKRPENITSVFRSDAYSRLVKDREKWADVETLAFTVSRKPLKSSPKKR